MIIFYFVKLASIALSFLLALLQVNAHIAAALRLW